VSTDVRPPGTWRIETYPSVPTAEVCFG